MEQNRLLEREISCYYWLLLVAINSTFFYKFKYQQCETFKYKHVEFKKEFKELELINEQFKEIVIQVT